MKSWFALFTAKPLFLRCALLSAGLHCCCVLWLWEGDFFQSCRHAVRAPALTGFSILLTGAEPSRQESPVGARAHQEAVSPSPEPTDRVEPATPEPTAPAAGTNERLRIPPAEKAPPHSLKKRLSPAAVAALPPLPEPVRTAPRQPAEQRVEQSVTARPQEQLSAVPTAGGEGAAAGQPATVQSAHPLGPSAPGRNDGEPATVRAGAAAEDYLQAVHGRIKRHLDYPRRARRLHLSGTVGLRFRICGNGELDDNRVDADSPHPILNQAALQAVRKAAPFPPPGRDLEIELPVVFSLRRF